MTSAARAPKFAADPQRRAMYAKLALARKELGLSEDDYRAVLVRVTGKASASAMSIAELDAAIGAFRAKGWQQKPATQGSARRAADHPAAKKARALWISLWQLGEVPSCSEQALEGFARRQMKCERLQWADQAQCYKLIEALKARAESAGWRQTGYMVAATEHDRVVELVRVLHEKLTAVDPAAPALEALNPRWQVAHMHELYALARTLADMRRRAEATAS